MVIYGYFLLFILFYHILITGLWWIGIEINPLIAWLKEMIRVILIIGWGILWIKNLSNTNIITKPLWRAVIWLTTLVVWWVLYSWYIGVSISQSMVGIKYTLWPLVILVWSIVLGVLYVSDNRRSMIFSIKQLWNILVWVLVVWFIWQWMKVIFPDLLMSYWYWPVWDFVVWEAAPIWYRTWPGGTMRRQGIFSWPNNYWYFLTAFSSVFAIWCIQLRQNNKKRITIGSGTLFCAAILLTYSRGALLWVWIQIVILLRLLLPQLKKYIYRILCLGIGAIVWLSIWKRWSTVLHFQAWFEWVDALFANPWWYGLWSSWPWVHYDGAYLPENQYLQVALDLWVAGLVVWLSVWWILLKAVTKKLIQYPWVYSWSIWDAHTHSETNRVSLDTDILLLCLILWGVWLAVIGMFLHVLEDSMVNYRYLWITGVVIWHVLWSDRSAWNQ